MDDITKEKIDNFLFSYTAFEEQARKYYFLHDAPIPDNEIPAYVLRPFAIMPNDLKNITLTEKDMPVVRHSFTETRSGHILSENQFFSAGYDVFIQKHARYTDSDIHKHKFYEICYVYSGECRHVIIGKEEKITVMLNQGDFIFIPPYQIHQICCESDSIIINIGIRVTTFASTFTQSIPDDSSLGVFFSSALEPRAKTIKYLIFRTNNNEDIRKLVYELLISYCSNTLYSAKVVNARLSLLFLVLMQNFSMRVIMYGFSESALSTVPAVLRYMEENCADTSAKKICQKFGYSRDYLNLIFKEATTYSISAMLRKLKMAKCRKMLITTDYSVEVIGEALGYRDTTNLIRSFKKFYGSTPAKYRKEHVRLSENCF